VFNGIRPARHNRNLS